MAVQVSAAGFILWLLLWLPAGFSGRAPGQIDRLFLLAPLSIVPLGLALIATPGQRDTLLHRVARLAQPPCALLVLLSFLFRTGVTAALLTLPWLLFGIWCALAGLVRLLPRGLRHTEELCLDFALLYLPVGCVWLFLARCGANPMDFSDEIVLLTAVHFYYAGFAALTMAGMTGRYARGSLYSRRGFLRHSRHSHPRSRHHLFTRAGGRGGHCAGNEPDDVGRGYSGRTPVDPASGRQVTHRRLSRLADCRHDTLREAIRRRPTSPRRNRQVHSPRMDRHTANGLTHGLANSLGCALCGLSGWCLVSPAAGRP